MKTGTADLPLHYGSAPKWLFDRMVRLSGEMGKIIVNEYGSAEFFRRISNPYWFQAFSCVLGFDWHSSGTTTTTMGALKMSIKPEEMGIAVCGGKKTSRDTPQEIIEKGTALSLMTDRIDFLQRASRLSAKVDNSCIQDGYSLYQHSFLFDEKGNWCVVQQGLNEVNRYARRYHWLGERVFNFVDEPHNAICGKEKKEQVLNMVAMKSSEARSKSVEIMREEAGRLGKLCEDVEKAEEHEENGFKQLVMPKQHFLSKKEVEYLEKATQLQPKTYEDLILINGMGPKKIRTLALIAQLVYGKEASWEDPVRFSFAHGGKDGFPFPVNRSMYDESIGFLRDVVDQTNIDGFEKRKIMGKLAAF